MAAPSSSLRVSGVCLLPDGRPAANVTVRMQEVGRSGLMELPPITTKYEAKTDQEGRFEFAAIPRQNKWMIQFQEEGNASDFGMRYALPEDIKAATSLFATIQIRKPSIKWAKNSGADAKSK